MNSKFNLPPQATNNESKPSSYSSREEAVSVKFVDWLVKKGINPDTLNSQEAIGEALARSHTNMTNIPVDKIIIELKKQGVITNPAVEKKVQKNQIEELSTERVQLKGLTIVDDKEIAGHLEDNKIFLEKDIFRDDKDLEIVYENALNLGAENESQGTVDTKAHCLAFAEAGLIKGGVAEVEKDLNDLEVTKELIKNKQEEDPDSEAVRNLNRNKKVATIIECAISYCVTKLGWYGKKISIERTSEFDDIKRGTDEIFEIKNQDDESYFMGLAIDVTYRGLLSEKFKQKFDKLLESVTKQQKTKIKYFKNHDGKMMKEFAVPKIVLFFNIHDVRELVQLVKNKDDPKVLAEFKNSPQKIAVMNQMIIQCELLASFAEKYHNSIFSKYSEIVNSIKQLAWQDEDIKAILDARHEDEVSHHIKYLIDSFEKNINKH